VQPAAEGEHAKQLLDKAFESWAHGLEEEEIDVLWAYQAADGTHALVNGIMRGSIDPSTLAADQQRLAADVTVGLESAVGKGQVPEPVVVWRGIQDLEKAFGVPRAAAPSLVGVERRMAGFQSTTTDRMVAIDEYLNHATGAVSIQVLADSRPVAGTVALR
jgi:hypothetical protein